MAATRIEFVYPFHTSAPLGTYVSSSHITTGITSIISLLMVLGMLTYLFMSFLSLLFSSVSSWLPLACPPYAGRLDGEEIFSRRDMCVCVCVCVYTHTL